LEGGGEGRRRGMKWERGVKTEKVGEGRGDRMTKRVKEKLSRGEIKKKKKKRKKRMRLKQNSHRPDIDPPKGVLEMPLAAFYRQRHPRGRH